MSAGRLCRQFGFLVCSLQFPFALSLIGIAVIAAGLLYHREKQTIATWLAGHLPEAVLRLRPAHTR
jgi:hypothetical protein